MMKLKIRCGGGGLVHCANNIRTIGRKKKSNLWALKNKFSVKPEHKKDHSKLFCQRRFCSYLSPNSLLRFCEHQILEVNQKSQNRTFHYKWDFTANDLCHEANTTTFNLLISEKWIISWRKKIPLKHCTQYGQPGYLPPHY